MRIQQMQHEMNDSYSVNPAQNTQFDSCWRAMTKETSNGCKTRTYDKEHGEKEIYENLSEGTDTRKGNLR